MATRSNLVIQCGKSCLFIYRHWDGYPAETGADIATKLQAAQGSPTKFLAALMAEKDEKKPYEPEARSVYELTTNLHGDIEWLYAVVFSDFRSATCAMRSVGHEQFPDMVMAAALANLGPLRDFVESVNADRMAINRRMAERKLPNEPYPMLEVA